MTGTRRAEVDERHRAPVRRWADLTQVQWDQDEPTRHVISASGPPGLEVDLLVEPRAGADVLVVALHGAIDRAAFVPPRFEWRRTLREVPHHAIYVADTTLALSPSLRLGWYLGSAAFDLTAQVARAIDAARERLGARRTVVFGSSGGGFAAAMLAHRLPGVLGIAFSPQATLSEYYRRPVDELISASFPTSPDPRSWTRAHRDRVDLTWRYASQPPQGRLWYIQNSSDPHHVRRHREPFQAQVGDGQGRVHYVDEAYGDGHVPPPPDRLLHYLDAASSSPDEPPR